MGGDKSKNRVDKAEKDLDQAKTGKKKVKKGKTTENDYNQLLAKNVRLETEQKMEEERRQELEKQRLKFIEHSRQREKDERTRIQLENAKGDQKTA